MGEAIEATGELETAGKQGTARPSVMSLAGPSVALTT